ncbi:MAG: hypothetical protein ACXWN4_04335 [Candidatus Limnocylindrales bacterium]
MIGCWHAMPHDELRHVRVCLGSHVGGYELVVERCTDEPWWRWMVSNRRGHEIESGTAPDASTAERLAEEAAFHIHPPSLGDWVGRLM